MRKIIILFLFIFLGTNFLFSQEEIWTIEVIDFEGLEKTKENYLRQFLQLREGEEFVTKHLQDDIQQLWNVGTNQKVSAQVDSLANQKIKITFQLKEKKTFLPILNFGGIKGNVWFQAGFIDFNWLGKGHQFLAFYQNTDNRHGGQIYYRIPYLTQKWGLAFNLLQWRSREPLFFAEGAVDYDYDNFSLGTTVIRNFGFRKRLELGAGFFREKYKKSESQMLDNPPGPDGLVQPKISSKVEYIHNFLDYHDFYLKGWAARGIWQTVFNFDDTSFFNSLILEGKKFHRFGKKGNLAVRTRLGVSTNNNSPFAPFVVDSRVNLRGSGNRIERGTAQAILNMEYRHTFLDFNNWAVQGVIFTDLGNWRRPGGELNELFGTDELRQFVGGGFRIIYKRIYDAILRLDYGVDVFDRGQRGIVIGLGQYF
ncbi:MAG: POTRA domain-containing protein [Saprospiraceae bacterium]